MTAQADCIFCKIIAGDIPAFKLYEDETTLSFMDINPFNDGHCLVIPKDHHENLFAMPDAALQAVSVVARNVAAAVDKALKPDGLNLVQANGPAAGQSVFHFHMHIFPRFTDDGASMNWGLKPGDMDHIAAIADQCMAEFTELTGRPYSRVSTYKCDDADYLIIAQGSVIAIFVEFGPSQN